MFRILLKSQFQKNWQNLSQPNISVKYFPNICNSNNTDFTNLIPLKVWNKFVLWKNPYDLLKKLKIDYLLVILFEVVQKCNPLGSDWL